MFAKSVILFCSVYTCMAHLCMLSPEQRSPFTTKDLNTPGSDSCILLKGPCGGTKPTEPSMSLAGGSYFTVIFQKNLNHFNSAKPGYWTVSMGKNDSSSFTELYRVEDTSIPSLSLYTAGIRVPNIARNSDKPVPMVIQTTYVTNNPSAPAMFYQCSDVLIRKGD